MKIAWSNQLVYLTKVIFGLLILTSVSTTVFILPELNLSSDLALWFIAGFILFFIVLFQIIYKIYKKMDELQKILHERSSVFTVTALVSIFGVLGVLQANHIIPLFNQFWILAVTIILWVFALTFFDKSYK